MAVSKIKIVSIVGRIPDLDKVIKTCGEAQIFQPDNALEFYENTDGFNSLAEDNPFTTSLNILKSTMNSANINPQLMDISKFKVKTQEINEYVAYMSEKLGGLAAKRKEILDEIDSCERSIDESSHFTGLNLNLKEIFECRYIKIRFGRIPKESYIKLESYNDNPYILFFPCTNDETHYWGVYFAPIESYREVDKIFSNFYFERFRISSSDTTPEQHIAYQQTIIDNKKQELQAINTQIEKFWDAQKDQCMRFYSKLVELDTYFSIKKYVSEYHKKFILVGWVPEDNEHEFKKQLDKIDGIDYAVENAEGLIKHSPPVQLKNKRLFKPFEFFIDMYGLPNYNEFDPTSFVAITYILLFGIMFGDLGQGIVVSIAGYLMWRFKNMKLGKILIPCGISSAFFGVVYGEVFGFEHALDGFYKTVFGLHEKPIETIDSAVPILGAAVVIGVLLVLIAMLLNIISSFKRKNIENAVFGTNGISGLIFYASIIFGLVAQLGFDVKIFTPIYTILFILLPLLMILFKEPLTKLIEKEPDWKPKSWGEYILQNFFEVFESILSFMSNTMSFLRVGAFVLVHAGMMMVVFILANMASGVVYVIAVILGNIFVIGFEGLLVGIQVLRLEFYEMFSRFFDGQGRPFEPITVEKHTL